MLPPEIEKKLSNIRKTCSKPHYNLVNKVCKAIFIEKSLVNISKWDIKILKDHYPEILSNKNIGIYIGNEIIDKLTFAKESL